MSKHPEKTALRKALDAAGRFLYEIKPSKNTIQRVRQSAEWRVGELLRLHFVKPIDGRSCQVVLAFKIMEECALGDPCRSADIIDGGGVESAVAHETDAGIDELPFCFGQLVCLRSG